MRPEQVLVVDDDSLFCESLVDYFARQGVVATYATSLRAASRESLRRFAVVVLDNHLPDGDGLALMDAVGGEGPRPAFIVVTGDPSYEHAIAAMRRRVFDYLSKPIELGALGGAVMRAFVGASEARGDTEHEPDRAIEEPLPDDIARFARSDVPILVTGETGTGKTRLAHRIHLASPRAKGPFVAINCATLAESIVEAELFGASRGAYTGASERPGLLALGNGGTLLLDEIGELPLSMQAKLLSVLEERRVRRIGASRWESLDVRIVAATHVDLDASVAEGRFRADLLYRLDVGRVTLPPLRAQPAEIDAAVAELLGELGVPEARLEVGELERLAAHAWPGNYRELRNALARSLVLHAAHALRPSACVTGRSVAPVVHACPPVDDTRTDPGDGVRSLTLAELERRHVLATFAQHGRHRGRTAQSLGISEVTLRRKLRAWDDGEASESIEAIDRG
jgi:DNA-binding NtrC family response regulator